MTGVTVHCHRQWPAECWKLAVNTECWKLAVEVVVEVVVVRDILYQAECWKLLAGRNCIHFQSGHLHFHQIHGSVIWAMNTKACFASQLAPSIRYHVAARLLDKQDMR